MRHNRRGAGQEEDMTRKYDEIWNGDGRREDALRRADRRYPDYGDLTPGERSEAKGRAVLAMILLVIMGAGLAFMGAL